MKKSKFLALGVIALLLAGGLVLASCAPACPDGGDCKVTFPKDVMGFATMKTPSQCENECLKNQVPKTIDESNMNKILGKTYNCDC